MIQGAAPVQNLYFRVIPTPTNLIQQMQNLGWFSNAVHGAEHGISNAAKATGHAVAHGAQVAGHDASVAGHFAYKNRAPIVNGVKTAAHVVNTVAPVADQFADAVDPKDKPMYDAWTHGATTAATATTNALNSQAVQNAIKLQQMNWFTNDIHNAEHGMSQAAHATGDMMYNGAHAAGNMMYNGAKVAGQDINAAGHWAYNHRGQIVNGAKVVASDVTKATPYIVDAADAIDPTHASQYNSYGKDATTIAGASTNALNSS